MSKTAFSIVTVVVAVSLCMGQPASTERRINLQVQSATFTKVCDALARQYSLNIIAELHVANNPPASNVEIKDLSEPKAVATLAEYYGREVIFTGKAYILRSKRWAVRREQDRFGIVNYGLKWITAGKVTIATKTTSEGLLRLDVEVTEASLSAFAQEFSKQTGWLLHVEKELDQIRLLIRWNDASPGELLEALTVLLGARQTVRIDRSEEQKRRDLHQLEAAADARSEEEKESEQLLPKLLAVLNEEEKQRWLNGERLSVPLSRLPSETFTQAYDYAAKRFQRALKTFPSEYAPPSDLLSNIEDVSLILPSPSETVIRVFVRDTRQNVDYVL
jgi:hypothetical protein